MIKILIGVVVAAFIVIVAFMVIDPNLNKNATGGTTSSYSATNTWTATIEGEVNKTGTYVLEEGATMAELIAVGGGVTDNADDLAYFAEAVLTKGMVYYIPPKYDVTDICSTLAIEKVNVNSDAEETLMNVNGITSSIASSIVSYRTTNGNFLTIESLTDVYGIGPATYKKVRNYVILHE